MHIAAFFDIDHTILEGNAGVQITRALYFRREITTLGVIKRLLWLLQYAVNRLNYDKVMEEMLKGFIGRAIEDLERDLEPLLNSTILPMISPKAVNAINEHKEKGHVTVLATSGLRLWSEPIQQALGVDHLLCTEVQLIEDVDKRVMTGGHHKPSCYGDGKLEMAKQFCEEHDVCLDKSYFYSDSASDLPLLQAVGNPVVVNPNKFFRRTVSRLGWPVQNW